MAKSLARLVFRLSCDGLTAARLLPPGSMYFFLSFVATKLHLFAFGIPFHFLTSIWLDCKLFARLHQCLHV